MHLGNRVAAVRVQKDLALQLTFTKIWQDSFLVPDGRVWSEIVSIGGGGGYSLGAKIKTSSEQRSWWEENGQISLSWNPVLSAKNMYLRLGHRWTKTDAQRPDCLPHALIF